MPLSNGSDFPFRYDGRYIHFKLRDDDMAFVNCAVDGDYLLMRGLKDGIRDQAARALFLLYKHEIEELASRKFDSGAERPFITLSDI